jgi:hypothetical protein
MSKFSRISVCLFAALALCRGCFGQVEKTAVGDRASVAVLRAPVPAGFTVGPNYVTIRVIRDGKVIHEETNHNLKTTGGVDAIFQLVFGSQPGVAKYLYLSTNSTAPAAGDCPAGSTSCTLTGILTSNGLAPAAATFSHTNGASTATLTYTWTASTAGTSNVQEAGISNSVTPGSGTVLFENTFTPVSLNVGDQLQLTWTITIS